MQLRPLPPGRKTSHSENPVPKCISISKQTNTSCGSQQDSISRLYLQSGVPQRLTHVAMQAAGLHTTKTTPSGIIVAKTHAIHLGGAKNNGAIIPGVCGEDCRQCCSTAHAVKVQGKRSDNCNERRQEIGVRVREYVDLRVLFGRAGHGKVQKRVREARSGSICTHLSNKTKISTFSTYATGTPTLPSQPHTWIDNTEALTRSRNWGLFINCLQRVRTRGGTVALHSKD